MKEIRQGVAFIQRRKNGVVHRFHRGNHEKASRLLQFRQQFLIFSQVLDFDGGVISYRWKFAMKFFYQWNGMADAVEKVWVPEGNVLCARHHLPPYVFQDNLSRHDAKYAVVHGNNRAVPAQMFAAPASLR